MKTQTEERIAGLPDPRETELMSWVQGICCEGRHDYWKAELLEKTLNEHAALVAVAEAAKELLMFGSFAENGTRADEAAQKAHCVLSKLAAVRDGKAGAK